MAYPEIYLYGNPPVDLANEVRLLMLNTVLPLQKAEIVEKDASVGVVVARFEDIGHYGFLYNSLDRLVGFTAFVGRDGKRCIDTAVQMMRVAARLHMDTHWMLNHCPAYFEPEDVRESGAVWSDQLLVSAYGLIPFQNHAFALMIGAMLNGWKDDLDGATQPTNQESAR